MPGFISVNQQVQPAKFVNPASEDQELSGNLSNQSVGGWCAPTASTFGEQLAQRVREQNFSAPAVTGANRSPSPSAHPLNHLIARLNAKWRVVDDPLQWILQRKKGNPRKKNSGWRDRSFCTTRQTLLRCVRETCGEVDDEALIRLRALPEFHRDGEPK